jgi:DcaP outer membrane protein
MTPGLPGSAGKRTIISCATVLALACVSSTSVAQTPATTGQPAADPSLPATMQTLVRTIDAQQKLLEEQGRQLEQLRREMAELRALVPPAQGAGLPAVQTQPPTPLTPAVQPPPIERPPERRPELPPDVVSAGDFPGSFKIPGSDAALKIGGMVRVNWVSTFDPLSVQDRFETWAIPVGSSSVAEGGSVDVIASPSRLNFDLRTPTGVGYMRAFIEGDFGGSKNTFRLRHAYGQWRRLIFGQTWSTFADPEAKPDGIDFEGLNAIVHFRQAQIRWSFPLSERVRMALALEDPDPDLTDATGVNQVPDAVARVRWEPRTGGHVQVSGLFRQLRGEPTDDSSDIVAAAGYGTSVSGRLPFAFWSKRDQVVFEINGGTGIGRYISDLRSLGGQDGVFDPGANQLLPLVVFSGLVGYEHWWNERLRSSLSFAAVGVENRDVQSDSSLHRTRQGTVNFMWSPIPRLDLVTEFLWGRRQNKNGEHSFAAQTQVGSTFRF